VSIDENLITEGGTLDSDYSLQTIWTDEMNSLKSKMIRTIYTHVPKLDDLVVGK